ncbi:unnamed protein product, partial [Nesidiocoris tenuis]
MEVTIRLIEGGNRVLPTPSPQNIFALGVTQRNWTITLHVISIVSLLNFSIDIDEKQTLF